MNKAIFLDRDGTLNHDFGYVHKIDDFKFIDGSIEALRKLKQMGYLLVLVTNQSGIGRGYFSEEQFTTLTEWMDWSLAEQGVDLDGIYYCPHHIDGLGEYAKKCDCRKPNTGMFKDAIKYLKINPQQSVMIGDKKEDIEAGINAGIGLNILVETGKPLTDEGKKLANAILPSLADLPKFLAKSKH